MEQIYDVRMNGWMDAEIGNFYWDRKSVNSCLSLRRCEGLFEGAS